MSSMNVGIEEARKRLGDLITAAQQGADVTITRNGKPAARIIRFQEDAMTVTDRDIREQVGAAVNANGSELAQGIDIDAVTREIIDTYGLVGIDDERITHEAFWEIVRRHDQSQEEREADARGY